MKLNKFSISGEMILGGKLRKFSKEVEAATENAASNKLFALFGSNNRIKRNKIKISSIKKM